MARDSLVEFISELIGFFNKFTQMGNIIQRHCPLCRTVTAMLFLFLFYMRIGNGNDRIPSQFSPQFRQILTIEINDINFIFGQVVPDYDVFFFIKYRNLPTVSQTVLLKEIRRYFTTDFTDYPAVQMFVITGILALKTRTGITGTGL